MSSGIVSGFLSAFLTATGLEGNESTPCSIAEPTSETQSTSCQCQCHCETHKNKADMPDTSEKVNSLLVPVPSSSSPSSPSPSLGKEQLSSLAIPSPEHEINTSFLSSSVPSQYEGRTLSSRLSMISLQSTSNDVTNTAWRRKDVMTWLAVKPIMKGRSNSELKLQIQKVLDREIKDPKKKSDDADSNGNISSGSSLKSFSSTSTLNSRDSTPSSTPTSMTASGTSDNETSSLSLGKKPSKRKTRSKRSDSNHKSFAPLYNLYYSKGMLRKPNIRITDGHYDAVLADVNKDGVSLRYIGQLKYKDTDENIEDLVNGSPLRKEISAGQVSTTSPNKGLSPRTTILNRQRSSSTASVIPGFSSNEPVFNPTKIIQTNDKLHESYSWELTSWIRSDLMELSVYPHTISPVKISWTSHVRRRRADADRPVEEDDFKYWTCQLKVGEDAPICIAQGRPVPHHPRLLYKIYIPKNLEPIQVASGHPNVPMPEPIPHEGNVILPYFLQVQEIHELIASTFLSISIGPKGIIYGVV